MSSTDRRCLVGRALAILALGAGASCDASGSGTAPPETGSPGAVVATSAATSAAEPAPAPPPPPGPTVGGTVNGEAVAFRWGIVTHGHHGAMIELYDTPKSCAGVDVLHGLADDVPGFRLRFEVPAGPGGDYFAGHPFGVDVIVDAPSRKFTVAAGMPALPLTLMMSPRSVAVTVSTFDFVKGAHVTGTIDGAEIVGILGSVAARGSFDAEICVEPVPSGTTGLREDAPATPAGGIFAGAPLRPRTVLAIVRGHGATESEEIDVMLKRASGSLADVSELLFYAEPRVPCPPVGEAPVGGPQPILFLQSIGGTARERPILASPQPATAVFPGPESKFGTIWPAWARFDELSWTAGGRVRGSLWTESAPGEDDPARKGSFGGRFVAVVCAR